nr:hypothetical protein [Tanacetum cinerariifolium]
GYLKFSAKGTKREVFRMLIPGSLITTDIREASHYPEYLANVTKHRRKPKPSAQKDRINILQYLIHLRMCKDFLTKMMKMFLLVKNLQKQNPNNHEVYIKDIFYSKFVRLQHRMYDIVMQDLGISMQDKKDLPQPGKLCWWMRQRGRLQTFEAYRMIMSFQHSMPLSDDLYRDLPRDNLLVRVEVLRKIKKEKSKNKGRVPTEMELELEHTQQCSSYEVSWACNSLVHSSRALSALRRSGLRTASTAAKPCQEDSSEFYLIVGSIHTDQRGTVVLATLFNRNSATLKYAVMIQDSVGMRVLKSQLHKMAILHSKDDYEMYCG